MKYSSQSESLVIKRTPSLNESHYSTASHQRLGPDLGLDPDQLTEADTTDNTAQPSVNDNKLLVGRGLTNEGFVRTGSGRKLPRIPDMGWNSNFPREKIEINKDEDTREVKTLDHRKPKPKALEFWESMENIERNDFRYNTIHRISMGRRLLPKPPGVPRSQSMDRSESANEEEKISLNSSFSGPLSLVHHKSDQDNSYPSSPRTHNKLPPDGASLQSHNSEGCDSRGEVEGSSNNNSPPTSVIQGAGDKTLVHWDGSKSNPAFEWVNGTFDKISDKTRRKWGSPSPVTSIGTELNNTARISQGTVETDLSVENHPSIPYDVLLQDLSQAKRQLLELHT